MRYLKLLLLFFLPLIPAFSHASSLKERDFQPLETLAIQDQGRRKPLLTFATESLQAIHGRDTFKPKHLPVNHAWSAMHVIVDLWLNPNGWDTDPLILVDYLPLRQKLGLPEDEKYFSYEQLTQNNTLLDLAHEVEKLKTANEKPSLTRIQTAVQRVSGRIALFENIATGTSFNILPEPHGPNWIPAQAASRVYPQNVSQPIEQAFDAFEKAYLQQDGDGFRKACVELKQSLKTTRPAAYPSEQKLNVERWYIAIHPSRLAWIAYVIALIILGTTWGNKGPLGYCLAWAFAGLGFALQATAFACRVYISGRPPVTNMYETVIWLAFGVMLFALFFEWKYKCKYFLLAAMPVSVIALVLADTQPIILNESIHPLVPVLRSNFWLTIHVLTITLSYAAFALSLGVGHIILIQYCFSKKPVSKDLYNYLYRTLQVGVWLLASGTMLGGVWANYSWGRFWGWDPKETWALIALLSYLAVLHGRIGGWWKDFGLAVGSVLCFLSVLMAWYGVNFVLGKGLHSYGFGAGGYGYVLGFVIAELLFVAYAFKCKNDKENISSKEANP
jgi:cytochrome c-type biogenesis protein CcsB